jgi:hypothetical protein
VDIVLEALDDLFERGEHDRAGEEILSIDFGRLNLQVVLAVLVEARQGCHRLYAWPEILILAVARVHELDPGRAARLTHGLLQPADINLMDALFGR